MYNTRLGEFCATYSNWEELLSAEPYNIKIKRDNDFVIFNYNQLSSDFCNEIVREARGIIFKEGEWECPVCHAFDKFGNYGEPYVPELDWSSVTVSEKIDGSIIKLWYYNNVWHVSTNSNICARSAAIDDIRRDNFEQVFWEAVNKHTSQHEWLQTLDTEYTYIFELVSPYNRVVIPYEYTDIYFLGARNNVTNQQYGCDFLSAGVLHMNMFPRPVLYNMQTLEHVIDVANELPWDSEGYVCYDKNFNRCKIKSPKYVMAHFARNNNVITRKHLIDIILQGEMDEFLIYAADYADHIKRTKQLMDDFVDVINTAGLMARSLRKLTIVEATDIVKKFHKLVQPIMFINLKRDFSGKDFVSNFTVYKWERIIETFLKFIGDNLEV